MKTKFLLPPNYKIIGWVLLGISLFIYLYINIIGDIPILSEARILCLYNSDSPFMQKPPVSRFFQWHKTDIQLDIVGILMITGCLFVAFSRLKVEDEFIMKIRLESLVWATIVNCILMIIAILAIWGSDFLVVMEYSMVTSLILFVIRFHYELFMSKKIREYEK